MERLTAVQRGFQSVDADEAIKQRALSYLERWLTHADFAAYRPQLNWLIDQGNWAGLLDRFYQVLPFGTGGRRGPVGVGPNRMNMWTLAASVQGHCDYLKQRFPDADRLAVVVGYDVRRSEDIGRNYAPSLPNPVLHLTSRAFAERAASVYIANAIDVHMLPAESTRYLATPELSFQIRRLRAQGGLNVSASHNPPDDNGGKFYDENGAQPVAPDDQIMSELVEQVTHIRSVLWIDAQRGGRLHLLDETSHRAYVELCRKQSLVAAPRFDEFKVVYTPLHGVGGRTAFEVLEAAGFRPVAVAEQLEPNGLFPNVTRSPNPEVPESLDRAIALARVEKADLVLATDPDADRIGAAARDSHGDYRFLTGNEIACLIAHFKLDQLTRNGRLPASPIVITTAVTTGLLTRIGRHFGAQVVAHLPVGFKHIAEVLRRLELDQVCDDIIGTPQDFVFGAEEAHGVLLTAEMRDKDAASAALLLAEASLDQKRNNRNLVDLLEQIHRQFGFYANELRNLIMPGITGRAKMQRMMEAFRSNPPADIGGVMVTQVTDMRDEAGPFGPIQGDTDRMSRNVLLFQLGDSARLAVRPSGTEPKAKVYVEVHGEPLRSNTPSERWSAACRLIRERTSAIAEAFESEALRRAEKH
jgi:phosphoglucomutase/phosphomannomutase